MADDIHERVARDIWRVSGPGGYDTTVDEIVSGIAEILRREHGEIIAKIDKLESCPVCGGRGKTATNSRSGVFKECPLCGRVKKAEAKLAKALEALKKIKRFGGGSSPWAQSQADLASEALKEIGGD